MKLLNTELILIAMSTYLFAAIPFGLVFSKIAGLGDIREIGSGNIGATNVLRTGNKKIAFLTLLFDVLKGVFAVLLSKHFIPGYEYIIGFLAIFAHIFPIYLKFKGGKGVATTLGVYFAWNPMLGISVIFTWLLCAKLFKISSLSAIVAGLLAPAFAYFLKLDLIVVQFSAIISVMILYTHRNNIIRLINKQESHIQ